MGKVSLKEISRNSEVCFQRYVTRYNDDLSSCERNGPQHQTLYLGGLAKVEKMHRKRQGEVGASLDSYEELTGIPSIDVELKLGRSEKSRLQGAGARTLPAAVSRK